MRKLKLQMNISLGDKWDDKMTKFSIDNLKTVDNIVLGRHTAEGFIPYWDDVAKNPKAEWYKLGVPLSHIPKVVFSRKLRTDKWNNANIIKGNITEEIKKLKKKKGTDIMVYGGDSFAASLVKNDLVDELYLLVNPAAIGTGNKTFNPLHENMELKLKKTTPFPSGIVLLYYTR